MSEAGKSILEGLQDAIAYAQGDTTRGKAHTVRVPDTVDVKEIREHLGLTQVAFAQRYGFALSSVQNWEQGRRHPEGPARLLLLVIGQEPEAVDRALASIAEPLSTDAIHPGTSVPKQRPASIAPRRRQTKGFLAWAHA
jgi:putative transcriptional regulator